MKLLVSILTATLLYSSGLLVEKKQKITAIVVNVASDSGKVSFALYNKETFMKTPLQAKNAKIVDGKSTVTFENIEAGDYSVLCFHDKNDNDKMDFQENGMPMEDYGASNNVTNFGPPKFSDSKFTVAKEHVNLEIKF